MWKTSKTSLKALYNSFSHSSVTQMHSDVNHYGYHYGQPMQRNFNFSFWLPVLVPIQESNRK